MTARLMVRALKEVSSTGDKLAILRQHNSAVEQAVLQAAYHPINMYGLKKLPWIGKGKETIESIWPALEAHLTVMAQAHGDDLIKVLTSKLIIDLTREDAEVYKAIILKDLRCGITATTINKVYPGLIPVFGVMLASQFKDTLWRDGLMGSVKLDGLRCVVRQGQLFSRTGRPIKGMTHIEEQLYGDDNFDGEIMVPGETFQSASGLIRSGKDVPQAKLFLFDCLEQFDLPFALRYNALIRAATARGWSLSLAKPGTITALRHRTFASLDEMYDIYNKALVGGYEGLVLKTPNHEYQMKRSKDWMKVKATLEEDAPIVGFYEGKGKYEGMLGGVYVLRANGKRCAVGGGFSDFERADIMAHPDAYSGSIIEIHYHEDTPDGDFRHARKFRFRSDKA